ncbi:hypothetical protein ACFPAG_09285 [Vogesella sp. GCM10023246]|uniref:Motility protein n=1 Tax=Vogesella oryzagri TaxID=3160864 RepID=A0ABV1M432_9NEIS
MEINGSAAEGVRTAAGVYALKQAQQADEASVLALLQGVPTQEATLRESPPNLGQHIDAWA